MFEKKELISGIDGSKYTKYLYKFNESDPIVGILFGHFAPFTGPNGHGRMITTLKNLGAETFLIATPQNNKPFDDEREMFDSEQRAEIIQSYLDSEGLEGVAISYKMKRGGAKSQMGPLVAKAAELFGLNIRPVFCFGPDREDLASEVCNKFGEIKDPTHCEYIVDYERGTSGTKVRELIKKGDIEGIMKETGYKKETAEMLINLRNENLELNKLNESTLNKFFESENKMRSNGSFKGFWYSSKEKIAIDIEPCEEHLEFLLKNPERLGIEESELEKIASKWGTTLKRELHDFYDMGDREADFLICGLQKGNLRIRFYDNFDNDENYLSVEYYDKRNLKKVTDCMIKYESDIKDSKLPIFLYDYKSEEGKDFKSVKDVLNYTLLNESIEENKENKLEEAIRYKVELDFANIYEADKFKKEMEGRFKKDRNIYVSSNFNLPSNSRLWNESLETDKPAYWYYKGEFFPIDKDDFHFGELLRNYECFGIKDDELKKIFSESDLSFKEFKDNPEAAIKYLSNIYAAGDDEDCKVLDMADEILNLVHSKGALRVRPLSGVTYITCSTLKNKKVRNEILSMLMEDGELDKNKAFIVESVDDGEWAHDLHASNLVDLMNKLAEF